MSKRLTLQTKTFLVQKIINVQVLNVDHQNDFKNILYYIIFEQKLEIIVSMTHLI